MTTPRIVGETEIPRPKAKAQFCVEVLNSLRPGVAVLMECDSYYEGCLYARMFRAVTVDEKKWPGTFGLQVSYSQKEAKLWVWLRGLPTEKEIVPSWPRILASLSAEGSIQ